jgi:hypothetical protein
LPMAFTPLVWSFAGTPGVQVPDKEEIDLGSGFSLLKPIEAMLGARDREIMSGEEYEEAGRCGWYLVFKTSPKDDQSLFNTTDIQNGLISFQIIKPTRTSGWMFVCEQWKPGPALSLKSTERRPPMSCGRWAGMREFDKQLLSRVPEMILKVRRAFGETRAELKNAIILLQLGFEHMHPLIAGLLHVMGMEAVFDSGGRFDFKKKLCSCLGPSTPAFPDWNPSTLSRPKYTVEELAVPIYMLRSKLAHGADLRKAALDKKFPVDLVKKVELIPEFEPQAHAFLLAEAASYLHCQVLQRVL